MDIESAPLSPCEVTEILYAMIKPGPEEAAAVDAFRRRHQIPLDYERGRLHVTVHCFGPISGLSPPSRDALVAGLTAIEIDHAPFRLALDRFYGKALRVAEGRREIVRLRRLIEAALLQKLPRFDNGPHMSLLYGARRGTIARIDPIAWTVNEIRLVGSLQGLGCHIDRGRMMLRPRQGALF